MTKGIAKQAGGVAAAVTFSVILLPVLLMAQGPDSNGESAVVIGHLAMPGPSANQMFLQRQVGKRLLYFDQGDKQGVAVIDITSPDHPRVVGHVAWPGHTANGQVENVGSGLAISERPDDGTLGHAPASQRVNVLDVTDLQHPQVLQTFSGVTSILSDVARNLIFIANSEGLWIVQHRIGQAAYAMRHPCTSEAAEMPEANCY